MKTVFFGYIHEHYNSVEGGVKYFYTPTYKSLLGAMIKHLVDEKLIDAREYDVSFSNAIDFMTDGEGCSVSVDGRSDEESIELLLDDLTSDNLENGGWFTYKAAGGGVIDPDKFVVLTLAYNDSYLDVGYNTKYYSIACREENVDKEFFKWVDDTFDKENLPSDIEEAVKLLNADYDDENGGLVLQFRIEKPITGEKIRGEDSIA